MTNAPGTSSIPYVNEPKDDVARWLLSHGVKFHGPVAVPLDKIDEKRSKANQARDEALDPDTVERYAIAIQQGDVFPPLVGYPLSGRFILIDGNHRLASHKRAKTPTVPLYSIDPTTASEMIYLLTVEANVRHGKPTTTAWRVKQAIHLISLGITQEQAAHSTLLKLATLRNYLSARKGDERARRLGVRSGWGDLSTGHRAKLETIRDDPVFTQVARITIETKLNLEEVNDLVKQVRDCGSESDRLQVVSQYAQSKIMERATQDAMKTQKRRLSNPKGSLSTGLGKVMAFNMSIVPDIMRTSFERAEWLGRLNKAADKIFELIDAIEALQKEDKDPV